jgi:hypothetical protein
MEVNELYTTGASATKSGEYTGGTPGLSSPNQLVNFTASVSVTLDQTAAGSGLLLLAAVPASNRAARLAQIRRGSFERLGNAWRILADR